MKTGKSKDFMLNGEKTYLLEYIFYGLCIITMMMIYRYADCKSMTVWSVNLLDCIVDGNLYNYYEVCHLNVYGATHSYNGFNFLSLIPWAIWNIPIWLIQRIAGIKIIEHTSMMIWSQLFLVFLMIVMAYYSKKIISCFVSDKWIQNWSVFSIITCPFIFFGVAVVGQSDIIVITVAVIAIYYLLQDKQWLFLLLMAYSISAKPFLVFAYIAVILLIEKNVLKAVLKILSSVSFMLVFNMIYENAPLYKESIGASTAWGIVSAMITNSIDAIGGKASFVIIGFVFIYFMAYCINYNKEDIEKKRYIIYMMIAPMLVYMAFANHEFYRKIYLLPFLIIAIAVNTKFWTVNLILEKVLAVVGMSLDLFGNYTLHLHSVNHAFLSRFGLSRTSEEYVYDNVGQIFRGKLGELTPIVLIIGISIYVAVAILLLLINIPFVARKLPEPKIKCSRAIYWIDLIYAFGIIALVLVCYLH